MHVFLLLFIPSEPDAPENFTVTVISSTSVVANWSDPLDPNGIITGFSLNISLHFDQEYLPAPQNSSYPDLSPSRFQLEIPGLHPFARYFVELRAATSFGLGNLTDAVITTYEAGTY